MAYERKSTTESLLARIDEIDKNEINDLNEILKAHEHL